MSELKIVIIGGGAAGFFGAINCAEANPNYKITIIEKTAKVLAKVRISGGGRCNVTHACFNNELLIKNYPRGEKQLASAFSRFNATDTINWFEQRGVKLKTEADGRIFPVTDRSDTVIDCLLSKVQELGISLKTQTEIAHIDPVEEGFILTTTNQLKITCNKVLITTGGYAKAVNYNWLAALGHTIAPPVPSLFTFNIPNDAVTKLMGVAVPGVKLKIATTKLESSGALLITHWGFSGPAILKLSAWGARILNNSDYSFDVSVNWLPRFNEEKLRIELQHIRTIEKAKTIAAHKPFELPRSLWEHLVIKADIAPGCRWADISNKNINQLIQKLINDTYTIKGKTTFKEEFVTCGGINLKEIDFKTMESKLIPNLYFAGEVIDIDGITGGFNFQNAWTTSWIAAKSISES